ncbi:universal stress protein [Noviherbaspirillum sp. UKPF54]|uniref:universal stress protein n=1 Tax=Noviherbaspirillum sp. UKPF54 TaxID=2601898 RepID=UPI001AF017EF|nr:universal stress protein [Noviherbaspirillum sp. UKPF54]
MSLKNLMVHLDQSERTSCRLALAVSLARMHQARLVGVFGQLAQSQSVGVVSSWPTPEYAAAAEASKAAFEAAAAGLPQAEWHDINRGSEAEVVRRMTDWARHADLVIMGQNDDKISPSVPADLTEEVVLNAGRPVLIIPYIGKFTEVGKRPLVAWSNVREAARALNDALPLMEGCEKATVMSFATNAEEGRSACDHVIRHLACHDIQAQSQVMLVTDIGIMDMLLNATTDLATDLLVMGAQGHIGLPFMSRGAGTRYILRHMTVPVLMSN